MTGTVFFPRNFRFFLDIACPADDAQWYQSRIGTVGRLGNSLQESVMRIVRIPTSAPFLARTGLVVVATGLVLCAAGRHASAANRAAKADPNLLAAQLEAGEFGPAVDAAGKIEDLAERVKHLKGIAAAQRDAGEFQAAEATASRIPNREERARTRGQAIRQQGATGQGGMANFGPLINLIETTVEPDQWEALGGPGTMSPYNTGVRVDPNGLLRQLTQEENSGALE